MKGKDFMKKSRAKMSEKTLQQDFKSQHLAVVKKLQSDIESLVDVRLNVENYDLNNAITLRTNISDRLYTCGLIKEEYLYLFGKDMVEDVTTDEILVDLLGKDLANTFTIA